MSIEKEWLAKRIFKTSYINGFFKLRSGQISNEYFDKYMFESDPKLLSAIALEAIQLIPKKIDCIAGLEMGGIPIATLISHYLMIPCLFIRKTPKSHGLCKYAEGGEVKNKRILIIEDVVSTGGAIIDAVTKLRSDGAIVQDVLCVIDRETGGKERLAEHRLTLRPIFLKSEIELSKV